MLTSDRKSTPMLPTDRASPMDFKAATDELTRCPTLDDVAAECQVAPNTIRRARMTGDGSRPAPAGWERAVAKLARARAAELEELAAELEG